MTEAERIEKESLQWPSKIELPNESEKLTAENSRLQQEIKEKDEEISTLESQQDVMAADTVRLMDQIEYQNKAVKEDHDKISKLEFELKSAQELNLELVDSLSQLMYAMNSTGLPWNTDSTVEKAYAKSRAIIKQIVG